jgi:NAD(P)-dependent dehydrogenase (short-subunit alcohol dehydrogenase family)
MSTWSTSEIGNLDGRFVVVTGANSGVGLEAAREFAQHGAQVVLACRDVARGQSARSRIQRSIGDADLVRVVQLDVSDLDSVRAFAGKLGWDRLDILVNNAGVMGGAPVRSAQGFDRQVATNHLGPFALTASLWPLLAAAPAGRVVNISSLAARGGTLSGAFGSRSLTDFTPYREMEVYAITKQANLLFTTELAVRAAAAGSAVSAVAAHPGLSSTNLFNRQFVDQGRRVFAKLARPALGLAFQSAHAGALPTLRAATDRSVASGGFVGPRLLGGTRGAPVVTPIFPSGLQPDAASALWSVSEQLTGVPFVISGGPGA